MTMSIENRTMRSFFLHILLNWYFGKVYKYQTKDYLKMYLHILKIYTLYVFMYKV